MTLVELFAAAAALSAMMGGLVWASNSLRVSQADRQTRQSLAVLRQALVRYHTKHRRWPEGPVGKALATLTAEPDLKPLLSGLVICVDSSGRLFVRDGFGQAIHYLAPGTPGGSEADTWQQPDFISAGPDGQLGDPAGHRPGRSDNIYGSDTEATGP